MSRDFKINGEAMIYVKGRAGSAIQNIQELGLAMNEVTCSPQFYNDPITLDAWGNQAPADIQTFLASVGISFDLIHYDSEILDVLMKESLGGASDIGKLVRAGTRLGKGTALYSATNNFFSIGISSPIEGKPWRFFACHLDRNPAQFPLGTKRKVVRVNAQAIPYTVDPWNAGQGAQDALLWDHVALS